MKKIMLILIVLYTAYSPVFVFAKKTDTENFSCDDGKRTCKDMDSCEDAKFHLRQCGMQKLDRDRDGVPCESICN